MWKALGSLKLAIACLSLLMVLVVLCTVDQVQLGTHLSVQKYFRSLFLWWSPVSGWNLPVFPGGGLVGFVLFVNLVVAQFGRLEVSWRKAGLWVVHFGLILLFLGEFVTGFFQVESQMAIDVGATHNYSESARDTELVVVDTSAADHDRVFAFPQSLLAKEKPLGIQDLPVTLSVKRFFPNASFRMLEAGEPALATQGPGARMAVKEEPPVTRDDQQDTVAALVEVLEGGRSHGTWLVSNGLGAPQGFSAAGKPWKLELRNRRFYLPYSLTLKEFRHDRYPGTDIPKNFSSRVRLVDATRGEDREVTIWMNNPLRYDGKTFYQSSFGKNDTLSVLLVVRNPGWLLPYAACLLVSVGLLMHFIVRMRA